MWQSVVCSRFRSDRLVFVVLYAMINSTSCRPSCLHTSSVSVCTDAVNGIQAVVFILNVAVQMQLFFLQGIIHPRYPLRHFGTVRNGYCTKLCRVGPWTQYRNGAGIVFGKHLVWYDTRFGIWMGSAPKSYRILLYSQCIVSYGWGDICCRCC